MSSKRRRGQAPQRRGSHPRKGTADPRREAGPSGQMLAWGHRQPLASRRPQAGTQGSSLGNTGISSKSILCSWRGSKPLRLKKKPTCSSGQTGAKEGFGETGVKSGGFHRHLVGCPKFFQEALGDFFPCNQDSSQHFTVRKACFPNLK